MIGLSPLSSTHPSGFQPTLVRTSIRCHPNFILVKDRSSRFASIPSDYSPYSDSVSLRHRLIGFASPLKITSRLIMQKARGSPGSRHRGPTACRLTVSGSISLPSSGFFSPFPHGTGSLSVGREYLAFEDGPPMFRQDCTCPALLFVAHQSGLLSTGLSPATASLSRLFD